MNELLAYLFSVTISLSGLDPIDRPNVIPLPYQEMMSLVCSDEPSPEDCQATHGLQSAYIVQTHQIVYRDDMNLDDNFDNSFIVHEFVHALQHSQYGDVSFGGCIDVFNSELQAYRVQQLYLDGTGQFALVGEKLKYIKC